MTRISYEEGMSRKFERSAFKLFMMFVAMLLR